MAVRVALTCLGLFLHALSPGGPLRGAPPGTFDSHARANSVATGTVNDEMILMFRREPRCQSQVVRVGDLIEVANAGKHTHDDLLDIPLAPAPQVGKSQEWTAQDVLRHLELRGVSQRRMRWSGPESVKLLRLAEVHQAVDQSKLAPAFVQDRTVAQAEANLIQATREYLWLKTGERTEWRISVKIPSEHALGLSQRRNIETIGGGTAPWVGQQELLIGYKHSGVRAQVNLTVQIDLPQTIVVTTRPMRRDEVIEASALDYGPLPERLEGQVDEYFTDFEQLVGKQLRRSLSTGLPVPKSAIGEPIVISSGELIEIESVAGSISVRTAARALSGGAVGDLINVELLSSRKRLSATVVGPLQVRIAGGAKVSSSPATAARPNANATFRTAAVAEAPSQTGLKR